MCGVAGIVSRFELRSDQVDTVAAMAAALVHRGPDSGGRIHAAHACIASRRLGIVDLQGGAQPLYTEDGVLGLVCNGEIYNHVELRRALEARGHRFLTGSDCEVILYLYLEYGDACVDHLRGMFAFALYDFRRERVLLARDRMGEKPLYLVQTPTALAFASELKALVAAGLLPFELDPVSVHQYFHFGYVPEPRCMLSGVRKLPAGHVLAVDIAAWRITERRYWRLRSSAPLDGDPVDAIRAELDRVGDLLVQADVPVGVALSGGLDSSIVAALAARRNPDLQAITLGYPGEPYVDERREARQFARHLGIALHEIEVSPGDIAAALPRIAWQCDEPFADIAGPAYHFIMQRAAAEGIRVLLDGQGGDELFWGYGWVRDAVRATERKRRLRASPRRGVLDYLSVSPPPLSYTGGVRWLREFGGLRSQLRQYGADRAGPVERMVFYDLTPRFQAAQSGLRGIYTSTFANRVRSGCEYDLFTVAEPWDDLDVEITQLLCDSYLLANGIAQSDRLAMSASVELRMPFVDYRLAEVTIGLRKRHRDRERAPKYWLREAAASLLPDFVLRRPKRPFVPPWRSWAAAVAGLHAGKLEDGLLVELGVLEGQNARSLARRLHVPRWGSPSNLAECALMLELWCRAFKDATTASRARAGDSNRSPRTVGHAVTV